MTTTLSINNLAYEELVYLQELLIHLNDDKMFMPEDPELFDSLFEKVMQS